MAMTIEQLNSAIAATDDLGQRLAIIRQAIPGRLVFATSLGLEDQALLHALHASGIGDSFDIATLDTGRHFQDTLDTLDASRLRYGLAIRVLYPDADETEALVARDGINGFRSSIDSRKACCDVRKVRPLNRVLAGAAGWVTGLRRSQSAGRTVVPFAERDPDTGLIKTNPLADWSLERLEAFVVRHDVPVNALHAKGFPSIGCQPCTRAIKPGEDIRAGRWWWENEAGKECGLHGNSNRPKAAA